MSIHSDGLVVLLSRPCACQLACAKLKKKKKRSPLDRVKEKGKKNLKKEKKKFGLGGGIWHLSQERQLAEEKENGLFLC